MKRIIAIAAIILLGASLNATEKVMLINIDDGISPAIAEYIETGIEEAEEAGAEAIIIKLNTPGGLVSSTRDIVEDMLAAKIPVIVYVAPGGARAGSAGVFITIAANIAAMAPGTNIGAAHPVGLGGSVDTTAMGEKVVNDAAAFVRTIAKQRDKNVGWAERAVRESISSTEYEALEEGVIDMVVSSIDSLLIMVDSVKVKTAAGETTLNTKNAVIEYRDMNWKEKLLALISNPNIAYIFILIGFYGIIFELQNPGTIFPGVLGGISLLLAAYSLQMMPVSYVGLGLMFIGIVLFVLEVFISSYGMLTVGGIIAFALGSIMLIDSPFEFMRISMELIITATILTALFFILIIGYGIKAQFRKKSGGGSDSLSGETGVAKNDFAPGERGSVHVHGELWQAESDEEIKKGDSIIITGVKGFVLTVKKNND